MKKINLLVLYSSEPESLVAFYELLGVSFEYHRHGKGPLHYSVVMEGCVFEIYPLKAGQDSQEKIRLGFGVEDLEELMEKLERGQITILSQPKITAFGKMAIIQDPEGRKIELTESSGGNIS